MLVIVARNRYINGRPMGRSRSEIGARPNEFAHLIANANLAITRTLAIRRTYHTRSVRPAPFPPAERVDSMTSPGNVSRRDFVRAASVTAGALASGSIAMAGTTPPAVAAPDHDAMMAKLVEGNRRFMAGTPSLLTRRRPEDFAALAEGQAPTTAILSCADSRVAPELIFDQGVGDLFVLRVAGNVITGTGPVLKGSLEFAVAELGVRLVVVMGHTACGAVKAAIAHVENSDDLPGAIGGLVDVIRPAVKDAAGKPGDKLENVTRANVAKCVATIRNLDPILSKFAKSGELKVVGSVYDLATGKVDFFV
jgi:carbonic anhydrase